MHELYDYVCKELKSIEDKTEKGLSAADIEYALKLVELRKGIDKCWMLEERDNSYDYNPHYSMSSRINHFRGGRMSRDRGYSTEAEDIIDQLEDMRDSARDERSRREFDRLIDKMRRI